MLILRAKPPTFSNDIPRLPTVSRILSLPYPSAHHISTGSCVTITMVSAQLANSVRSLVCVGGRHVAQALRTQQSSVIRTPGVQNIYRSITTSGKQDAGSIPVNVSFRNSAGEEFKCVGRVGETLLDVAIDNNIDLEGACGGTLACSTCHLYIDEKYLVKLDPPQEEEEDMLDLAFGLQENSRLGCQCFLTTELDGFSCELPNETSDARG